jgi:FKBP-type peptidyl-prolyl cis-trans isomerase SlyD
MGIQIVSFRCILKNKLGRVISSTVNTDVITHAAGADSMLRGLAEGLRDLKKGEKRSISLAAPEAYGYYDPKKVTYRSRDEIPDGGTLRMGDQVILESKTGERSILLVTQIEDDQVTLDGNHPLAGQDLVFEIEAIDARDATPEEIADALTVEPANEAPRKAPATVTEAAPRRESAPTTLH